MGSDPVFHRGNCLIKSTKTYTKISNLQNEPKTNHIWLYSQCRACWWLSNDYRQTSNINRTLIGKTIAEHLDAVGASTVSAALTTSSFWLQWIGQRQLRDEKHLSLGLRVPYIRSIMVSSYTVHMRPGWEVRIFLYLTHPIHHLSNKTCRYINISSSKRGQRQQVNIALFMLHSVINIPHNSLVMT